MLKHTLPRTAAVNAHVRARLHTFVTRRTPTAVLPVIALFAWAAAPARSAAPDAKVSFKRDVAPILLKQCQTCHGPEKVKGKYRVDSFAALLKPGSSGDPAVSAGKPDQSTLYTLLVAADEDERMPQKADPLPKQQVQTIRRWIEQGAAFDGPDPNAAVAGYADGGAAGAPEVYKRPVPVTALAFTPDGAEILASGYHELTRWNSKTGKLAGRLALPVQRVQAIAVDGHSGRVAVAGGTPGVSGELLLIDKPGSTNGSAADGSSAPRTLERTADLMLSVRFSPDGKTLAAGGSDGGLRVYDLANGKLLWKAEPHADWVTDLSFSPDGALLVTASRDKSCRVFEVKTGLAEASYNDHPEPVFAVAFAADGKTVFSGGRDRKLHMWSAANGQGQGQTGGFAGDLLRLARVGPRVLSAGGDGKLREHAADQGVPQPAPEKPATKPAADAKKKTDRPPPRVLVRQADASAEWLYAVAASEPAGLVAAGSHDGRVHVYRLEDGEPVTAFVAAPGWAGK